jgi:hypothetical protein
MRNVFGCLVILLLAACGASLEASVKKRAAYDMDCSEKELFVEELSYNPMNTVGTYGVQGCDKRTTYVCQKNAFGGATCVKDDATR